MQKMAKIVSFLYLLANLKKNEKIYFPKKYINDVKLSYMSLFWELE